MGSVIPSGNLAAGSWKPITKPDRGHRRRPPQSRQAPEAATKVPIREEGDTRERMAEGY